MKSEILSDHAAPGARAGRPARERGVTALTALTVTTRHLSLLAVAVEPPTRTVETWLYDGWPGVEAVESVELREADGMTKLTHTLAFRDQAGRDHMTGTDGLEANYDSVENLLRSLLDPTETVSG